MEVLFRAIKKTLRIEENPNRSTLQPTPAIAKTLREKMQALKNNKYNTIPLEECRFVIFDTETTGLEPFGDDEIISISAVALRGGEILQDDLFDRLVDPHRPVPPLATEITGITEEMVLGQADFFEVFNDFLDYVHNDVLVAHHAEFDLAFINKRLKQCQTKMTIPVVDTFTLSRSLYPTRKSHQLDALLKAYEINQEGHVRHSSLGDSYMTAELFVKLLRELTERRHIATVGDLMHHLMWRSYY